MHYFRSEEHLKRWTGYSLDKAAGTITLPELEKVFAVDLFRNRLEPDYVTRYAEYSRAFAAKLREVGKRGEYWIP